VSACQAELAGKELADLFELEEADDFELRSALELDCAHAKDVAALKAATKINSLTLKKLNPIP
jgi:hypothetical protein